VFVVLPGDGVVASGEGVEWGVKGKRGEKKRGKGGEGGERKGVAGRGEDGEGPVVALREG